MSETNRALGGFGVGKTVVLDQKETIEDLQELIDDKTAELTKNKTAMEAVALTEPPSPEYLDAKAVADKTEKELTELNAAMQELREIPVYNVTLMPMNQAKEGAYGEWLEGRARDAARKSSKGYAKDARMLRKELQAQENGISADERDELVREINRLEQMAATISQDTDVAITAGEYEYGSENARKTLGTIMGLAKLLSFMLEDRQPQTTQEVCKDMLLIYHAPLVRAMREVNDLGKKMRRAPKV